MAGKTFSGTYTNTIVLKKPGQSPATLTGSISVSGISAYTDSGFYANTYGPWSITNLGTITATGDTSYGILLLTGGTIQNGQAGQGGTAAIIRSDETGVLLTGAVSKLVNDGTITGTLGRAVFLQDGGTVTNGNTAITTASIIGGFEGVAIYNAAGSLTNFGTILDTGSAGLGVELYAGNVSNRPGALISGVYGLGFVARYATGTLSNAGTILGTGRDGVELSGGGTVTNSGSIGGAIGGVLALYGATTVTNSGMISGAYAGIDLQMGGVVTNQTAGVITGGFGVSMGNGRAAGAVGSVVNDGVITASTYQGVSLNQGGGVVNTGAIYGAPAGVAAFYGAASLTNSGSIGGGFAGVDLLAGGTVTNAAGGTISGAYGVVLANGTLSGQAAAPSSLSNSGQITAGAYAGVAALTNGTFINAAGGTITGGRYGVYVHSVTGTIANYGVITGASGIYGRAVVAHGTRYPGQLTIINAGTINATSGAAVSMFSSNDLLIDRPGAVFNGKVTPGGGRLELAAGGPGTLGTLAAALAGFGTITVDPGASWTGGGVVSAGSTMNNLGGITIVSGGALTDKGLIEGGAGSNITLLRSGTLSVLGTVQASTTIVFGDSTGHVSLTSTNTEFAPIRGFASGDTIYLPNTPLTGLSETYVQGAGQGTLTIVQSGTSIGQLTLIGTYTTGSFSLKADAAGGSDLVIPCLLAGTRIALADGVGRIERLRVGMRVLTAGGAVRPIRWIGQREVAVATHADPASVRPVRIAAHAFGPGRPRRDLFVSPDHAVLFEGALIPAGRLIGAGGVGWSDALTAHYYHLELDSHDILMADGLPVESYLENGFRDTLGLMAAPCLQGGGAPGLQGGGAPGLQGGGRCAPLALSGSVVARARRHLVVQAGRSSPRVRPEVTVLVEGQALVPARHGRRLAFRLPPLAASVTMVAHRDCAVDAALLDGRALAPLAAWITGHELRLPRASGTARHLELFLSDG